MRSGAKRKIRGAGPLYFLAASLGIVALAGIGAVKFFETPRGRAVLLDRGYTSYYAQVQDDAGMAMHRALSRFDLDGNITETVRSERQGGAGYPLAWRVRCGAGLDLLRVNGALTDAVKSVGGRVRHGEERDDGRTVELRVGTRRFETHRVTITSASRRPVARRDVMRDEPGTSHSVPPGASASPRVAIVIDDFGYSEGGVAKHLLDLDLPLTIAILPELPHSRAVLDRARREGRCTLLHLPLEAGSHEPFDVAPVTVSMSGGDIDRKVRRYLDDLDGVDGVNNHQGSLATADTRVMRAVLGAVRERDLFFLDSLTSPKSVAYNTARSLGIPAARNNIFLDDDTSDPDVVGERVRRLADLARRHGSAIGIGHPHRWTLEGIENNMQYLRDSRVDVVPVCRLVR